MNNQIKFKERYMSYRAELPSEMKEQREIFNFRLRFLLSNGRRNDIRQYNRSLWEKKNG